MSVTVSTQDRALLDVTAIVVRALVLYSLAEHQSGHAMTIRVTAEEASFSVADDGRGHSIERVIGSDSCLKFIYAHLGYPFESGQGAPVQLQGLGMSLITALCSELSVTVRKPHATLRLSFRDGHPDESELSEAKSEQTGNEIAGTISLGHQQRRVGAHELEQWMRRVLMAAPRLKLSFNGSELQGDRMKRVLGIGGIFIKAKDPAALRAWYGKHLGMASQDWGGTVFQWKNPDSPQGVGTTVWSVFDASSDCFAPSTSPFMINYRVANLHELLSQLRAEGCNVDAKVDESEFGKFGWVMDPEGNRIELWEPPAGQ